MNDTEINIAIAECYPQSFLSIDGKWFYAKHVVGESAWEPCIGNSICHDLNAMHEAENKLADLKFAKFVMSLRSEYLERTKGTSDWGCISATARERAEALLRTIGKWKDAQ